MRIRYLVPLGIFLILSGFLAAGLFLDPGEVPSPLIGKPAPDFSLPRLDDPDQLVSSREMAGKVWLLNVWASWCVSCRQEHPLLVELSRQRIVPIYGLNYKDKRQDAVAWLNRFGDPYLQSFHDLKGRVGMDFGVYGVPETYVIDADGVIRFKQIGPITLEVLQGEILPLVSELQG